MDNVFVLPNTSENLNSSKLHYIHVSLASFAAIKSGNLNNLLLKGSFKVDDLMLIYFGSNVLEPSEAHLYAKVTCIADIESPRAFSKEALAPDYGIVSFKIINWPYNDGVPQNSNEVE